MRQRIAAFRRLDSRELGRFWRAWRLILVWWIRMRVGAVPEQAFQVSNADSSSRQPAGPRGNSSAQDQGISAVVAALHSARDHHFLPPNALCSALTLWQLLRDLGLSVHIVLGIRREGAIELNIRAWVVCDGQVIGEQRLVTSDYKPIHQPTDQAHAINWLRHG